MPVRNRSSWLLVVSAVIAALTLAPATAATAQTTYPQYTDRGTVPLTATTTSGGETARMPDGTYRTWLAVTGLPAAGVPAYLAEIDPFTRTVVRKLPMENASGAWGVSVADNGDVYVATSVDGDLFRLPWGSADIENLGRPLPDVSFLWEGDTDENGTYYIGTYHGYATGGLPPAHLVSWDPDTRQYRDYGTFGDRYTYVRSVEYVDGQLYVGVGPFTAFYRVDPVTGDKTEIALPPGVSGDKYTYQLDDAGGYLYVLFAGGVEPAVGWVYDVGRQQWSRHGSLGAYAGQSVTSAARNGEVYMVRNGELTAYQPHGGRFRPTGFVGNADLGGLGAAKGIERVVDPATGHEMIVGGQPTGLVFQYDLVTGEGSIGPVDGLTGTPTAPRSLAVGPDDRVYGGGYFSGGLVAWDPDTTEWSVYEFHHQIEGMATHDGILYLGVYPNAEIYAYDPAQPFSDTNPKLVFDLKAYGQERPWTLVSAGDYLAIGTSPKNSETEGALALYDPGSGTHRVFKGIAGPQEISALTYRDGVVYGGSLGCCPSKQDGRVFALDAATGEKLWDTVPMPGEHGVNGLAFDDQGRLFGLTAGKSFELDLTTHQVTRSAEYVAWNWPPTVGFQPRAVNLVFDPHDGFLYGTVASRFVRIDPETLVNTAPGVRAQPSLFATSSTGVGPKYFLQGNNRLVESLWYPEEEGP
ncbi:PQQ-binding-like beta-propeller repeat protein [Jiangella alkaliphila]|uniref:PQQ enzyme repeat-containing protein n=1 Tax=Jiangella alkaliphila TaxID=419479 RepID=A0A1H2IU28_9ACTN|nr:PQQ-binding-like beta-propeller repeat protein [Jiangella alkaliphila]SDU47328.1 PQQ enzyme repeat-containing protein [Jiangella alkaliphila]